MFCTSNINQLVRSILRSEILVPTEAFFVISPHPSPNAVYDGDLVKGVMKNEKKKMKKNNKTYKTPTWRQQHDGRVQGEFGLREFQQGHGPAQLEGQRDQLGFDRILRVERVGRQQGVRVVDAVAVWVVVSGHPQHGQLETTCWRAKKRKTEIRRSSRGNAEKST